MPATQRRGVLDVIVVDFFHWPKQGDWKFDLKHWPDPDAMIRELNDMGTRLMVSIWPTVDVESENHAELAEMGGLIQADHGNLYSTFMGYTTYYDATHPGANEVVWRAVKKNYFDKGIDLFWLDQAEPETASNDMENVRYHIGSGAQVANIYPFFYSKAFYDGMTAAGMDKVLNLVRCAWAGSQRFGTLLWSGDVYSSWRTLREQIWPVIRLRFGIRGGPATLAALLWLYVIPIFMSCLLLVPTRCFTCFPHMVKTTPLALRRYAL